MREKSRIQLLAAATGFLVLIIFVAALIVALRYTQTPASSESHEVIYEITPSKTFATVSEDLYRLGVINNARSFYIYSRIKGKRGQLKVGEYALNTNMVPGEVLAVITSGKSRSRPFLVPEGYNVFEIAELYEKQGFGHRRDFLGLVLDKEFVRSLLGQAHDSFEGYLFPETYQINKFTTTREVITAMVRRFQSEFAAVLEQHSLKNFTQHQAVTLASIIEKETGAPQERRLISSVFHNRLKKNMRLQTDPTVIYGMAALTGRVPTNIRKSDLLRPSRYNTYVIFGLPPGPIANPGKEALMAALNPETTDYLYFVSQNNGTHIFTSTYNDHINAVRKFQMDPRARAGKSWRDLKKTN